MSAETDEANHQEFQTNRSKDQAYMEEEDRRLAQAELQTPMMSGTEFFEHKDRRAGLKETLKNYTPYRFALNSSSSKKIDHPRAFYVKKGIRSELFADTSESDHDRFMSVDGDMTNRAIALDNYDFFLKHNSEIKVNLAKVMLAKLDVDVNSQEILNELLAPDSKNSWKDADPDAILKELKNRLRKKGLEYNDRYIPLFKLINKTREIGDRWNNYKKKRQKGLHKFYNKHIEKENPFNSIVDQTAREKAQELFLELSKELHRIGGEKNVKLESVLYDIQEGQNKGYSQSASDLIHALRGDKEDTLSKGVNDVLYAQKMYEKKKEFFTSTHNKNIESSTKAIEQVAFDSKRYPISILAYLSDEKYFDSIATPEEKIDIQNALKRKLASVMPAKANIDIDTFIAGLKARVAKHKDLHEHIYDASKDEYNSLRQYLSFESVANHDMAGNILRDALYLELMQYDKIKFGEEIQKEIISSSMDKELMDEKPSVDEVLDTHNAIQTMQKTVMGEISQDEADVLYSSPLFNDSTVLNSEDVEGLRRFTKNLAESTKTILSKDIIGTPKDEELKSSIQELHYLNHTQRLISKLRPDKEQGGMVGVKNFIGRNFFQNNKALFNLEKCMKNALNPTTHVETIPSLTRNCIEKLKDEYDKEVQDYENQDKQMKGWMALTPIGAIAQIMPLIAKSKKDMLNRMIEELNDEIHNSSLYVNSSRDDYEKMGRYSNVQNEKGLMSGHLIDTSFATEQKEKILQEGIAITLLNNKDGIDEITLDALYGNIEQDNSEELALIKRALEDERSTLQDLKDELLMMALADKDLEEYSKEYKEKEIDYDSIVKKLEIATPQESEVLKEELERLKFQLEKQKELLLIKASSKEKYKEIQSLIGKSKEQIDNLIAKHSVSHTQTQRIKTYIKEDPLDNTTTINLKKVKGADMVALLVLLASLRNKIDEKILIADKENSSDLVFLQRDREKTNIAIEELTLQTFKDDTIVAETISESLRKTYGIKVDSKKLEKSINKQGIGSEVINYIMDNSQSLTSIQKRELRSELFSSQKAHRLINQSPNGETIGREHANVYSSFLSLLGQSEMMKKLKRSGDVGVAIDVLNDKDSFIKSAKGELGYYIAKMDTLEREISATKDDTIKEEKRNELNELIGIGERKFENKGVNFDTYRDIATKQVKNANNKEMANSQLDKRSNEIRRRMHP